MRNGLLLAALVSVGSIAALVAWLKCEDRSSLSGDGEPLLLFCAGGFNKPVEAILEEYRAEFGARVHTVYKGSDSLLAEIRAAGGGDLYLPADVSYLRKAPEFLDEELPLGRQRIVLAVARGNPLKIAQLDDLLRPEVRLSLTNPEVAAVTRLAKELLQPSGHWEPLYKKRIVERLQVNETANDIVSAAADAGFVWDATLAQYPELEAVPLKILDAAPPTEFAVAVLKTTKQPTRALHLARYLAARDKGLPRFAAHGYRPVEGDEWAERPEIRVFSGALNRPAVEATIARFELREGVRVITSYEGCGSLVGKMSAGEHPDVYFACDRSFLHPVADLFLAPTDVSSTPLVIIAPRDNPRGVRDLRDFTLDGLKLGLGDPEKATLGDLTRKLLLKYNLWDHVRASKSTVTFDTGDRVVQAVVAGGLEAAVVYRANALPQQDKLLIIPLVDPEALAVQPIAVGKNSSRHYTAERLRRAILSAESRDKFEALGFRWLGQPDNPEPTDGASAARKSS